MYQVTLVTSAQIDGCLYPCALRAVHLFVSYLDIFFGGFDAFRRPKPALLGYVAIQVTVFYVVRHSQPSMRAMAREKPNTGYSSDVSCSAPETSLHLYFQLTEC